MWRQVSDSSEQTKTGNYKVPSRGHVGHSNFKGADRQKFIEDPSGGGYSRLHLALTLEQNGSVLLPDEPSNDLDVETLRMPGEALLDFPGSVTMIFHNRWSLNWTATHILPYEDDSKATFLKGNYTEFKADHKKCLGDATAQPHRVRHRKLA